MLKAPEAGNEASTRPTAPLVLIVDDSIDHRQLYAEFLEFCGFRVVTAEDGEQGIAAARHEWPAVILMDLSMPVMDGWEAIQHLRDDPMTRDIPIVALSAYAFGDDPIRARDVGADLCLAKPCLPSQVARVVRAMLFRSRLSPAAAAAV
jgi:two-component system, cell cycle response regulator DivK